MPRPLAIKKADTRALLEAREAIRFVRLAFSGHGVLRDDWTDAVLATQSESIELELVRRIEEAGGGIVMFGGVAHALAKGEDGRHRLVAMETRTPETIDAWPFA
jgi:hypothetical protein